MRGRRAIEQFTDGSGRSLSFSPRIDVGTLLAGARRFRRRRSQTRDDPFARVERVDDVVYFEMGSGVHRLAVAIHPVDHLVEQLLALPGILDGGKFVAIAELHRSLQSHAAEFSSGPRAGENRGLETAA